MTSVEQINKCIEWIIANDADQCVSMISPGAKGVPTLYMRQFSDFKRLFAGKEATRHVRGGSSTADYDLEHAGIRFLASEWLDVSNQSRTTVIL
jgi:hypothetical protein